MTTLERLKRWAADDPDRETRDLCAAAAKDIEDLGKKIQDLLDSNGLWPPEERHLFESTGWIFDLQKAIALQDAIDNITGQMHRPF